MVSFGVTAARIQRNLCDPRISVVFDPVRTARSFDISHTRKRLNRLDFTFGHSVFSLLMVNSKGESSSVLILLSDMKSASNFLFLKVSPYSAVSFRFRKFAFLVYFDALRRLFILRD